MTVIELGRVGGRKMHAEQIVIVDSCAVDRFADTGLDSVEDIANTEFRIAFTPDLKSEYLRALDKPDLNASKRRLFERLLANGDLVGFFGFSELGEDNSPFLGLDAGYWAEVRESQVIGSVPPKPDPKRATGYRSRTDVHLAALGRIAIVITADADDEAIWQRSARQVIQWNDFKLL